MQLNQGALLQNGKYKIIGVLGQGGFGITYLAENIFFERKVAIKEFFPKDFCGRDHTSHLTLGTQNNAETVEKLKSRFLKEAQNIAKLDHPGIIKIHDIFEENNTAYYVMDFIDGDNLNDIVKHGGRLSETKAVEYISKISQALEYIHSKNMTHFDVKPSNIILRRSDDTPILIDFGFSKQYDDNGDATSTIMTGVSQGYSPRELYYMGSLVTFSPQSDIYSLGGTLYYLITATVPPLPNIIDEEGLTFPSYVSDTIAKAIRFAMSNRRIDRPSSVAKWLQYLVKQEKALGFPSSSNLSSKLPYEDYESTRIIKPKQKSPYNDPIEFGDFIYTFHENGGFDKTTKGQVNLNFIICRFLYPVLYGIIVFILWMSYGEYTFTSTITEYVIYGIILIVGWMLYMIPYWVHVSKAKLRIKEYINKHPEDSRNRLLKEYFLDSNDHNDCL